MSVATINPEIINQVRGQKWWPIGILITVIIYLAYAWGAFNMSEVLSGSRLEKGALLLGGRLMWVWH